MKQRQQDELQGNKVKPWLSKKVSALLDLSRRYTFKTEIIHSLDYSLTFSIILKLKYIKSNIVVNGRSNYTNYSVKYILKMMNAEFLYNMINACLQYNSRHYPPH